MTKKWTEREALTGGTVEPDSLTDEFRAQQSSITTLDREQLPDAFVEHGDPKVQYARVGLDRAGIAAACRSHQEVDQSLTKREQSKQ